MMKRKKNEKLTTEASSQTTTTRLVRQFILSKYSIPLHEFHSLPDVSKGDEQVHEMESCIGLKFSWLWFILFWLGVVLSLGSLLLLCFWFDWFKDRIQHNRIYKKMNHSNNTTTTTNTDIVNDDTPTNSNDDNNSNTTNNNPTNNPTNSDHFETPLFQNTSFRQADAVLIKAKETHQITICKIEQVNVRVDIQTLHDSLKQQLHHTSNESTHTIDSNPNTHAIDSNPSTHTTSSNQSTIQVSIRLFKYRNLNYIYNDETDQFQRVHHNTLLPFADLHDHLTNSTTEWHARNDSSLTTECKQDHSQNRHLKKSLFGVNTIETKVRNVISLLLDEVLHPFYLFQVASVCVWLSENYYIYAVAIAVISSISSLLSMWETRSNMIKLKEMTSFHCGVNRLNTCSVNMRMTQSNSSSQSNNHSNSSSQSNNHSNNSQSNSSSQSNNSQRSSQNDQQTFNKNVIHNPNNSHNNHFNTFWTRYHSKKKVLVKHRIDSTLLLPGDFIEIENEMILPCDCVLVHGSVIMNESMLTGESTPTKKVSIPKSNSQKEVYNSKRDKSHTLFSGTQVIMTKPSTLNVVDEITHHSGETSHNKEIVIAMVTQTGFQTAKGKLVLSILHPKPNQFSFYSDSMKFLLFMFLFGLAGISYSLYNQAIKNAPIREMITGCFDLITTIVPPALPIAMTTTVSLAISRLKKKGIFCISPPRINVSGRVNLACFDKTNTLTRDGLDLHGVVEVKMTKHQNMMMNGCISSTTPTSPTSTTTPISNDDHINPIINDHSTPKMNHSTHNMSYNHTSQFSSLIKDKDLLTNLSSSSLLVQCMATCHNLSNVFGKLVGDPLDVKLFEATRWKLLEPIGGGGGGHNATTINTTSTTTSTTTTINTATTTTTDTLHSTSPSSLNQNSHHTIISSQNDSIQYSILKVFDFKSSLQRMSVIAQNKQTGDLHFFVKGSAEMLKTLSHSDTIPNDFSQVLYKYSHKGYRVLGCATRKVCIRDLLFILNDSSLDSTRSNNDDTRQDSSSHHDLYQKQRNEIDLLISQYADKLLREEVESNLCFLGLICMENKLKPETPSVIRTLNECNVRSVVITGDNPFTTICVARKCGILQKGKTIYLSEFKEEETMSGSNDNGHTSGHTSNHNSNHTSNHNSSHTSNHNSSHNSNHNSNHTSNRSSNHHSNHHSIYNTVGHLTTSHTLQSINDDHPSPHPPLTTILGNPLKHYLPLYDRIVWRNVDDHNAPVLTSREIMTMSFKDENYELAVIGEVFDRIVLAHKEYIEQVRTSIDHSSYHPRALNSTNIHPINNHIYVDTENPSLLHRILASCQIYARVSPSGKMKVIEEMTKMDYMCIMCGDGSNDVEALKSAHVGVSLSEAEASIAAPFTSIQNSIRSVVEVMKEGRASLSTSFQVFKFMALYSLFEFFAAVLIYRQNATIGDFQYLYIDLFIILPIVLLQPNTRASTRLKKEKPPESLFSRFILVSLLGQIFWGFSFMLGVFFEILFNSKWYRPDPIRKDPKDNIVSYETTITYLACCFSVINAAITQSISKPFKRNLFTDNFIYVFLLVVLYLFTSYILFEPCSFLKKEFQFIGFPIDFKLRILGYGLAHLFITYLWEMILIWKYPFKKLLKSLTFYNLLRLIHVVVFCGSQSSMMALGNHWLSRILVSLMRREKRKWKAYKQLRENLGIPKVRERLMEMKAIEEPKPIYGVHKKALIYRSETHGSSTKEEQMSLLA
ncbi:hypothetical protein C9374_013664 [Naegleria lovaniensis]|uniref:P-type ATPase A domain-containing protein n=1 Tax=Naegleria lovaniensis TaxID=51637 RepID=A0AA88G9I2_NAELO|nr:uncharacterized protein C9374_013664 [Naegleria lovaniensis]KAG2372656.1 hypothetical protein C9374_013664 [Naegleria lovaniensis]